MTAMPRPVVFLDLETTGIGPDDEPWEFAAIRREMDGSESTRHFQIRHDRSKAANLPESFFADYSARFVEADAQNRVTAAWCLGPIFANQAMVVGAVPSFDTGHLTRLLDAFGMTPAWHHRVRCVESMAVGFFGREVGGLSDVAYALGVPVPAAHTAMGDVLTVRAVFDLMTKSPSVALSKDTLDVFARLTAAVTDAYVSPAEDLDPRERWSRLGAAHQRAEGFLATLGVTAPHSHARAAEASR